MDLDDDSENDSDYVPGEEGEEEEQKGAKDINDDIASSKRKRKVNAIWEEIKAQDHKYIEEKLRAIVDEESDVLCEQPPKKMRIRIVKFFKTFFRSSSNGSAKKALKITRSSKASIKDRLVAALPSLQRKTVVTEARKFAGEAILVHKTVSKTREEEKPHAQESSIDKVLQTLKGPKQINTVSKSAMDWDNFKEKEGISDEIAAVSKDGYLGKQEFLQSCDVRRFEIEKEQRTLNREKK
eukprot:gene32289-39049_t